MRLWGKWSDRHRWGIFSHKYPLKSYKNNDFVIKNGFVMPRPLLWTAENDAFAQMKLAALFIWALVSPWLCTLLWNCNTDLYSTRLALSVSLPCFYSCIYSPTVVVVSFKRCCTNDRWSHRQAIRSSVSLDEDTSHHVFICTHLY